MKSTKKALISAIFAVTICCAMFVGSTFAWFTDQAESKANKVVAGDLEIELRNWTNAGENDYEEINDQSEPLFLSGEQNGIYWEPGKTEVRYLSLANVGTLDVKYTVAVRAYNISCKTIDNVDYYFNEVMEYDIVPNAKYGDVTAWENDGANVVDGINATEANNVALEVGAEHFFALAIHMSEDAGNQYEKGEITFDIRVIAGQLASEVDAFGSNYDELATYPNGAILMASGTYESNVAPGAEATAGNSAGTFSATAKTNDDGKLTATITPTNTSEATFELASDGKSIVSYDINVTGHENYSLVEVEVYLGKNLVDVVVYHDSRAMTKIGANDTPINQTYIYNASTGYAKFYTETFSPFDFAYFMPGNLPLASVSKLDVTEINTTYGMGGASFATDMHVAYSFKTTETYEEAQLSPYAKYHADFVVKVDRAVPANSIGLSGYYVAYCDDYNGGNWVTLTADVDIPANEEIRLLDVMLNGENSENAMYVNYEELCNWIPEFLCGVTAYDESIAGTVLTVELRLYEVLDKENSSNNSWNEETGEYLTVCQYQYKFPQGKVSVNPFN